MLDILFEWLTILWKVFKPHRYAATVVFLWGLVATLQAATTTWSGIMTARFFLGAIECGFGPCLPFTSPSSTPATNSVYESVSFSPGVLLPLLTSEHRPVV